MFRFLPWRREGLSALLRLILVVGLLEGVRSGYFAGLLPFYAPEHLGLGPAAFTLAFTLHQLAENLSKAAGGLLAERLGYGLTVTLAAATGLLALLLTPRADSAWILWTLGALWGLTFSSLYPGLMTLASRIARPGMDARALAFTLSLVMPWVGLGLVGVGQVAQRHPLQALHLLLAAQGLALLVALSLVRFRIPVPPPSRERYPLYRLLLFVPAAFGQTFAPGLVSLFLLRFAKEELGLEPLALGGLLVLGGGAAFLLLPFTGRLVDRRGYQAALVLGLFLLALVMARLGTGPHPYELPAAALLGARGFRPPPHPSPRLRPSELRGRTLAAIWGSLMTVEGLGLALGPVAGGLLWEAFGLPAPFLAGSGIFLALSLFYLLLFRVRKLWRR